MEKISTTIITGFLGSGKTTIINNIVQKIWDKEKIAIIKNEIGDVGVDALELSGPKLQVTELPNGCICCTLVGALNDSILEILEKYSPDRIFIEASGLAKPGQIAIAMELIEKIEIDGVIVVIDALNYKKLKEIDKSNAGRAISEFVDLYIINKADQISENEIDLIKDDILGNIPMARVIETSDANLPPELFIGLNERFLDFETDKEHHHDNSYDGFESFAIADFEINDLDKLKTFLENLPKRIYRLKGFFTDNNLQKYIVNGVAGKIDIKETKKELPQASKIVFIGKEMKSYEKNIENFIKAKNLT